MGLCGCCEPRSGNWPVSGVANLPASSHSNWRQQVRLQFWFARRSMTHASTSELDSVLGMWTEMGQDLDPGMPVMCVEIVDPLRAH